MMKKETLASWLAWLLAFGLAAIIIVVSNVHVGFAQGFTYGTAFAGGLFVLYLALHWLLKRAFHIKSPQKTVKAKS